MVIDRIESMIRNIELDWYILPPSAKFILHILKENGSMTISQLSRELNLCRETIRYAIRLLIKSKIVIKDNTEFKGKKGKSKLDKRFVFYTVKNMI